MLLHRSTQIADYTGRTLEGVAYRYEHPSRVTDDNWATSYYEEILNRADTRTLRAHDEFPLTKLHSSAGGSRVGSVTFHRSNNERALLFVAQVDRNPIGDELLEEIEEWRDASATFDPIRNSFRQSPHHGTITQRAELRLHELALAPLGTALAAGSGVTHVRSAVVAGTPMLDAARRRRASLIL